MKKFVILLVVLSIAIFGITLTKATYFIQPSEAVLSDQEIAKITPPQTLARFTPIINKEGTTTAYPSLISIPKIGVNAKIQQVGITKKNNVSSPYNFTDAGWYKYGTFPGDIGNAIIDGHVDNGLGFNAVFANLKNLNIGDDIYVTTGENQQSHFVVTGSDTYDFNAELSVVTPDTDKRLLKLITCAGTWSNKYHTHDHRLVVSAELVD